MAKTRKHRVGLFDPIPLVPHQEFFKTRYPKELYDIAWHLVGPTIRINQREDLQTLICIAFIEGARFAIHFTQEQE